MLISLYKKKHKKNKINGINKFLGDIQFGFYGIFAVESAILLNYQLETVRRIISRVTKRIGKVFLRIKFVQPMTQKPLKSRMGKGIGNIKKWISYIKKGTIILEISNIQVKLSMLISKKISHQLPMRVGFISRDLCNK